MCDQWFSQPVGKRCVALSAQRQTAHYFGIGKRLEKKLEPEFVKPIEQDRLLIVTPFDKSVKRISIQSAQVRNQLMISLDDQITIGYASPSGQLEALIKGIDKPINSVRL